MISDTETIRKQKATPTMEGIVLAPSLAFPATAAAAVAIPTSGRMSPDDRQALRDMLVQWNEEDRLGDPEQQDESWALLSRLLEEDHP